MTGGVSQFEHQLAVFPQLVVPRWLDPQVEESLEDFASRMAQVADMPEPCVVGGLSFGGLVALEVARQMNAGACILISSVRGPHELSQNLRWLIRCARLPWPSDKYLVPLISAGARWLPRRARLRCQQFADQESHFLRWAYRAIAGWKPKPLTVPVYQIHGSHDRTFPLKCVHPTVVVAGGTHELSRSHPDNVNAFIHDVFRRVDPVDRKAT